MKMITMNFILVLLMSFNAHSENIIESVLLEFVEQKLPVDVYNRKDAPWEFGTYSIKVVKNGKAILNSSADSLKAVLPVKVNLWARIEKDIGIAKISVNCLSVFFAKGKISLLPDKNTNYKKADAKVDVIIPDVNMNCDGLIIPISNALRKLVSDNKFKWESELQNKYKSLWVN